ncbi:hypothetical protein Tco_0053239 [Tanacetum coccineum]
MSGSTEPNPKDHVKSISTAKANSSAIRCIRSGSYDISDTQYSSLSSKTVLFPSRQHGYYCDDWKEASLVDLGASVSVMPLSTYSNLDLGNLAHTSLKSLDEGYSSKNYVWKFLRALHPKWRAKAIAIEELKYLISLSLDELIGNLKVHEMIIKKDYEIVKAKGEEYAMVVSDFKMRSRLQEVLQKRVRISKTTRNNKKTFQRIRDDKNRKSEKKYFRCGDPNHLIGECPKPPKDKNQRAFIGGSWSDSGEEDDEKAKYKMCLVAQASNEIEENDNPDDITDIFKIEGNLLDFEAPLCKAFNNFNYLLKIDKDLFTFDIQGIGTYKEYELINPVTRDLEEPCSDIDGFCNGGELPGMVRVGSMTYFQDHKWYDELADGRLN